MTTEVGSNADDITGKSDDSFRTLEQEYKILQEETQLLINDRTHLENELRQMRRKVEKLQENIQILKLPPLIVGFLQDILDSESAIVRSSNGTVFQVGINPLIDPDRLKPGTRVALNQDTLSVVEVLSEAWDPMVSGAEVVEKPTVKYTDVAGVDEQLDSVREAVELPLKNPELFTKVGVQPPKGVLLVGPPGCGKTLIAKAVAHHTDATFIRMVGSELAQKYIGEGGRLVRELFSLAVSKAPAIIFLDEIDAIGAKRLDSSTSGDREVQRTLMQLLAELDGFDSLHDVKIIAATNRPDILDDALLRPGRFDRIVEIPLPDEQARKSIIEVHLSKMNTKRVKVNSLIEKTKGYSGADLKALCVEAGMIAIRNKKSFIEQKDLNEACVVIDKKKDQGTRLTSSPHALYS